MICPICGKPMEHTLRFSPDKDGELFVCRNCYFETNLKAIKYNSLKIIQDNKEHDNVKPETKNKKLKSKKKKSSKKRKGKR